MLCKNCGKEIDNSAAVCPFCGAAVESSVPAEPVSAAQSPAPGNKPKGCSIAAIGIVLMIVSAILDIISIFMITTSSADEFTIICGISSAAFLVGLLMAKFGK